MGSSDFFICSFTQFSMLSTSMFVGPVGVVACVWLASLEVVVGVAGSGVSQNPLSLSTDVEQLGVRRPGVTFGLFGACGVLSKLMQGRLVENFLQTKNDFF